MRHTGGVVFLAKNILVVDDQFGIRILLQEVLEREGYHVQVAADGHEALNAIRGTEFDLVLLDMKIPGMDGIEILTNIRKVNTQLKVIMMTAYGELDLIKEAAALQAIGHFTKPFDIDEIKRFVIGEIGAA